MCVGTVVHVIIRVRFSHENAATDLGAERDRVLAIGAGDRLLKSGVDRAGPVVAGRRMNTTLTIHFQH